jgi:hypothetical protein
MSENFGRIVKLTIFDKDPTEKGADLKGVEIEFLKIDFEVKKTSSKEPNYCRIDITNCSQNTIAYLEKIGNIAILEVGYAGLDGTGKPTVLFTGNIVRFDPPGDVAVDEVVSIEVRDGYLEYRDTRISVYKDVGASALKVLKEIVSYFKLPVENLPVIEDKVYANGYSYTGKLREAMDRVCRYLGLSWSIQNRRIRILKKGETYTKQFYHLTYDSGLEFCGRKSITEDDRKKATKRKTISTERKAKSTKLTKKDKTDFVLPGDNEKLKVQGVVVKTRLNPLLLPGDTVKITSKIIDGDFYSIDDIEYRGSNVDNEFYCRFTAKIIKK